MYERLQTVRLRLMGRSVLEIAEIIGRSDKTICNSLHAYEKEGLPGLVMRFSPGLNQRLTEQLFPEKVKIKRSVTE
ncbi:helix-turn-helix domain-containing protein [Paenibacillus ginsengihumi]|uniref:helix-turn-helix domain-containing protein n=1 Tax=Paenibacillus ginsengihumi TaxID=431596 RepID=UPI00036C762B|nr:helix-turn-helix domain-containing protein [Paenibacillus ginsengihumi]